MQLAQLRRDERTCTFTDDDGNECKITYRPSAVTPAVLSVLRSAGEVGEQAIVQLVTTVVTSWELYDGDEQVPITAEAVDDLPLAFLTGVLNVIQRDLVDATEGKASAAGSSRTASSSTAPNGTGSTS